MLNPPPHTVDWIQTIVSIGKTFILAIQPVATHSDSLSIYVRIVQFLIFSFVTVFNSAVSALLDFEMLERVGVCVYKDIATGLRIDFVSHYEWHCHLFCPRCRRMPARIHILSPANAYPFSDTVDHHLL